MSPPQPKPRSPPLLVRLAKIFGLAISVLFAGMLHELLTDEALGAADFRSGMGYAYLAGASILIAFSSAADDLRTAATRAAGLSALGLALWVVTRANVSTFDVFAGLTGVWYTTLVRRL